MDRRYALLSETALPDIFSGAALLADISGFTPLTEALVQHMGARRGAEELTSLLNNVYTDLVSRVHHFGGSVVCFIGDALIACFPEDNGLRALASAFQMQRMMKQFQGMPAPHGGRVNLEMKAAVAVGTMRRFLVGDSEIRRIDVIAGQTIDRLSDAEHAARPGEVVASPEVIRRLGGRLIVDEWRSRMGIVCGLRAAVAIDTRRESVPEDLLDSDILRPYLLQPVYQRVSSGQGDFLSELRPVAVVFLRFSGIDYDNDPDAGDKLNAYTAWVQAKVQRYGGHVLLLTTADKGSHLYAVFGALEAHEDDCHRAVSVARELLEIPEALNFITGIQVGVSYGRARVGAYGGETRRTYGALGDVVNLAARLMGIAPIGEMRCSQSVAERAKHHWEFEPLDAVQLKGMQQKQPVFRPSRRGGKRLAASNELIGRQEELESLVSALDEAKNGSRRIRLMEGEAGIGKSRLVDELVCKATKEGFVCLSGAGDSIEQHTPYRAWRDVLAHALELHEVQTADEQRERVLSQLSDINAVNRASLLNDVLQLEFPDTPWFLALAPEVRQESLAALVGEILTRIASTRPLMIILDDVHWLDSLSWGLLVSSARALAQSPALLLCTHRFYGDMEPAELTRLAGLAGADRMRLGPLPADATLTLAASQLGLQPEEMPEPVANLLRERSEGNPFYACELVNALRDAGQLIVKEGICSMTGDEIDLLKNVPSTLEGVVLSRLDHLPDDEQLTMKVASVIGRSFPVLAVERAYPSAIERVELIRHLADTTRRRLTQKESDDFEPGYAFQHVVTQQVTYDTLLFEQRRALHRNVAKWLEESFESDLSLHYPLLVFHWNRAGRGARELRYCRLAGQQAAKKYANAEAAMYFSRALTLLDELGEPKDSQSRFGILSNRVKALAFLGSVAEERADLESLLTMASQAGDLKRRGEVLVEWADHHNRCGQFEHALDSGSRALESFHDAKSPEGEARALMTLGKTFEEQGEFAKAREHAERALEAFKQLGDGGGQAASTKSLGIIHARLGELQQAMDRFNQARDLYRMIGDRKGEADLLGNLGALSYYLGDYEATIRYTQQAQPMFEEMGNLSGSARCLSNLGNSYGALGAFSRGLDCHERSLAIYEQLEDANSCADSRSNIGNAYHALGVGGYPELSVRAHEDNDLLRRAIQYHAEALRLRREIKAQSGEAVSLFSMGSVCLAMGDVAQAESLLVMADQISQELGLTRLSMRSIAALARANLMSGNIELAMETSERVMAWLGSQVLPDADEMRFTHFRILEAVGRDQDARECLQTTVDSILKQSEAIRDSELKRGYLGMYHEVLTAWKSGRAAT